jgi:PKD repeat protein
VVSNSNGSDTATKVDYITVNAPVSVTSINANTMQAGTTINVTITGSSFAGGASVSFENGQGPAPEVSNILFVDDTTLTADITAKSGGPPRDHVWDVRVTNPNGSTAVLAGGFTVVP